MGWLEYGIARGVSDLIEGELTSSRREGESYLLPDEQARQRALAALAADGELEATQIDVSVLSGVLRLSGSVPTEAMQARAAELCRGVAGVREVENALRVG